VGTDAGATDGNLYRNWGACEVLSGMSCNVVVYNTGSQCSGHTTNWTQCRCLY
jgi:hypothetical protein